MSLPRLLAHLKQGWSTHKDAGIHHRQSVQTKELPFLDACTGLRSLPHGHQNLAFNDNIQGVHRVCCLLIWSDTSGSPRTLVQEPALKAIMAYTHTHTHTHTHIHTHTYKHTYTHKTSAHSHFPVQLPWRLYSGTPAAQQQQGSEKQQQEEEPHPAGGHSGGTNSERGEGVQGTNDATSSAGEEAQLRSMFRSSRYVDSTQATGTTTMSLAAVTHVFQQVQTRALTSIWHSGHVMQCRNVCPMKR